MGPRPVPAAPGNVHTLRQLAWRQKAAPRSRCCLKAGVCPCENALQICFKEQEDGVGWCEASWSLKATRVLPRNGARTRNSYDGRPWAEKGVLWKKARAFASEAGGGGAG
eukprot:2232317-Rhodomonas_salina.1